MARTDLIRRGDALDALQIVAAWSDKMQRRALSQAYDKLHRVAMVDAVEVVHARWMSNEYGNTVCSACACELPGFNCYDEETDEEWDEQIEETPFCPLCGAKMDGGAEG